MIGGCEMGVVATERWLRDYWKEAKNTPQHVRYLLQFDTLLKHIHVFFPHMHRQDFHQAMIAQGMFLPESEISRCIRALLERNVWHIVENEYQMLKKEWQGPNVSIYIFPVNEENEIIMNELGGKTGMNFFDKILLFVSSKTKINGVKALLTHEYHHSCRLAQLAKEDGELTLLDSVIIEGLAEFAVLERFGDEEIGKWTSMYDDTELKKMWDAIFQERLHVRGKEQHRIFLYGHEEMGIPKWAGYAVGYALVKSCQLTTKELLKLSSQQILKKSRFSRHKD